MMDVQSEPTETLTDVNTTDTTLTTSNNSTVNPFLINLTHTYHVQSIPLAIFLLIISCIFAILLAVLIICLVRWCLHRYFVGRTKSRRKKPRAIYTDEIPGLSPEQQQQTSKPKPWLQYSIEYKLKQQLLVVAIMQCHNITSQFGMDKSEFYVTLTSEHVEEKTGFPKSMDKVHKTKPSVACSGIASWNELFSFHIPEKAIAKLCLSFSLYEVIPGGRDYDHGQLNITLQNEDMSEYVGSVLEKYGQFGDATQFQSHDGELCIGMAYYPRDEKLDLHVLEAAYLPLPKKPKTEGQGHIYIVVSLKTGKHVLKKFQTDKRKDLESPYFNQKFSFKLKNEQLASSYIYCSVKYHSGWSGKKLLGNVWIGLNSVQNSGVKQWEETINNPSKVHICWHSLIKSED